MKNTLLPIIAVLLLTFPLHSLAVETLVKNLPESGNAVTLSGSIDTVLKDSILTGKRRFVFRDASGLIDVEIQALHPIIGNIGITNVRVTGTVERSLFGFGSKYIDAGRVEIIN